MTKLLAGALAAILTFLVLPISSAHAGFGRGLKAPPSFAVVQKTSDCDWEDGEEHWDEETGEKRRSIGYRKRPTKPVSSPPAAAIKTERATITRSKTTLVANSQVKPASGRIETERSSIATGNDRFVTVEESGCKNYFPSAGMTLSVSCE
jgi:hypothetical protein